MQITRTSWKIYAHQDNSLHNYERDTLCDESINITKEIWNILQQLVLRQNFSPVCRHWRVVSHLVFIHQEIITPYEALLLRKGADGSGAVDSLQEVVVYWWAANRFNPLQLAWACHVNSLENTKTHKLNCWSHFYNLFARHTLPIVVKFTPCTFTKDHTDKFALTAFLLLYIPKRVELE